MLLRLAACLLLNIVLAAVMNAQTAEPPLRLAIAGLVHGHAAGFLRTAQGKNVIIAGIYDPEASLHKSYAARFDLAPSVFFTDLNTMGWALIVVGVLGL